MSKPKLYNIDPAVSLCYDLLEEATKNHNHQYLRKPLNKIRHYLETFNNIINKHKLENKNLRAKIHILENYVKNQPG